MSKQFRTQTENADKAATHNYLHENTKKTMENTKTSRNEPTTVVWQDAKNTPMAEYSTLVFVA